MKANNTFSKVFSCDMVASFILERILKGEWRVGEKIPPVDQLETMLPVSRATISKGVGKLCRQGYLRTAWRSGTYVRSNVVIRRILLHVGGDQGVLQTYPFSMAVTRKLETLLTRHDMQVEIQWEARRTMLGDRLASDLTDGRFHGVVSVQSNLPATLERELPSLLGTLPIIHVGIHHQVPWVFVDMTAFNRLAADFCRHSGLRRVLYVCPPDSPEFNDFSAHSGLAVRPLIVDEDDRFAPPREEQGYRLFCDVWPSLDGKIDAIISADDMWAKGIVQAMLTIGLEKTGGLQVVALTNKGSGVFYPFPVQAIETDTDEITKRTLEMLTHQLANGVPSKATGIYVAPALCKAATADHIHEVIA